MKQIYFLSKILSSSILMLCVGFLPLVLKAQTTETFESQSDWLASFTSNSVPFTIEGGSTISNAPGFGYLSSNKYIDNYNVAISSYKIKSTSPFSLKSLYLYPSIYADGNTNQTVGVNVTFTGKLAGTTKFTYTPPSSDFTTAIYSNPINRGFSLVNFATPGYNNITIDELVLTLGGGAVYGAIDNFTWGAVAVNSAPTNVALSASAINENVVSNSTVGTLSSTDPDAGNTFTYSLVSGTGSTDNASFNISGSNLQITNSPDYETKSSYSVRVRTTDQGSLTFEKAFTITINDLNEAPTNVALSASDISENVPANSTIGILSSTDPDAGNTFTYTLVSGTGDTDNSFFNISGSSLRFTNIPDYEAKSSYTLRVRTTDQGSLTFEKAFTITLNNVNEAPVITAPASINVTEDLASALTGFSFSDVDAGSWSVLVTLSSASGGTLNATSGGGVTVSGTGTATITLTGSIGNINAFVAASNVAYTTILNSNINVTLAISCFDGGNTGSGGGMLTSTSSNLIILAANDAPSDIAISASAINENVASNATVGSLNSTDVDAANTFTYTLVAGTGSTDNASFNISGSSLRITSSPDFETKSSYTVRVRTTDQGSLTFEKAFTITINDLNEAPSDIALSTSAINENVVANSAIGTLSSTDVDAANTFNYTLVAGAGSTDNASFNISGSNLRITSSPDFEAKSSYTVRVRTTDQGTLTFEKAFTIAINDLNETPTDIALSASAINENVVANSTVGTLSSTDPDAANTFTYTLVAGTGSTDNASFNISGSSLRITSSPDFETKSSYTVRVRTTDQGTLTFEKAFTITINDLNEAPSDIALSASTINENVVANSTVGTLSSTDVDAANTFTYTLVAGTGSTDNASFNISGSSLRITGSPDFETKSSYTVRVRATDQGTLTFEKAFTITINDLNETPTDIALTASAINENIVANSTIGTLSSTDIDAANTFTYTLVAGTGSTDNASFNIIGSSLRITGSPDFETKNSYSVRVRTTDQGSLTFEKAFTITINDVNEAPSDIALSASAINENVIANSTVGTLSSTDADAANTFTYTLVAGTGSADNAFFNISGSNLRITGSPDFETKSSYSVRVRTSDQGTLTFEKAFTITINDLVENVAPIVTTQAVTNIFGNTATGNGNITDLGIPNPTQYGVVWSTSTNPTVALSTKTTQGTIAVTGAFTSSITGLTPNTQYFVKAYATNIVNTSYGNEVSFTTALTGIANLNGISIKLFPNPANETVNLATGNPADNGTYTILAVSGKIVAHGVIANGEAKANIKKLSSGIYIVQIQIGTMNSNYRIVKN